MYDFLLGVVDLLTVLLIVLPLYPNTVDGHVYAVKLTSYIGISPACRLAYWGIFAGLILVGILKVVLTQFAVLKGQSILTGCSLALSVFCVFLLGVTREAYAISVVFALLVIKGILLMKQKR